MITQASRLTKLRSFTGRGRKQSHLPKGCVFKDNRKQNQCIICRTHCKMQTWAPCSKYMKSFKMVATALNHVSGPSLHRTGSLHGSHRHEVGPYRRVVHGYTVISGFLVLPDQ